MGATADMTCIVPRIQVELILFKEMKHDNGHTLLRAYKSPVVLISKKSIDANGLTLVPATMTINEREGEQGVNLGKYSVGGSEKSVYLQKDVSWPSDKNTEGFIPFFWLVETTTKVESMWVGKARERLGGEGSGIEKRLGMGCGMVTGRRLK